jgi:hypothetical protein
MKMLRFSRIKSPCAAANTLFSSIRRTVTVSLSFATLVIYGVTPLAAEEVGNATELGPHEFIILPSDGYGTSDCLSQQSVCGKAIADAWCQSHGHARALGYSAAQDITGIIRQDTPPPKIPQDAIVVNCGS